MGPEVPDRTSGWSAADEQVWPPTTSITDLPDQLRSADDSSLKSAATERAAVIPFGIFLFCCSWCAIWSAVQSSGYQRWCERALGPLDRY